MQARKNNSQADNFTDVSVRLFTMICTIPEQVSAERDLAKKDLLEAKLIAINETMETRLLSGAFEMPALKDDGVNRFWRETSVDKRGREYEGYVNVKGQWDGPGIAIFPSGASHEGYWKEGKLDGQARSIWPKTDVKEYSERAI